MVTVHAIAAQPDLRYEECDRAASSERRRCRMADTEQEILEEQQEIREEQQELLEEVREIKREVKGPGVLGRLFLGSLAGAVVGVTWTQRRSLAGVGKRVVTRG
jgi:hypothetical protein